jgi:ATP-dependent Clp protease ATP-binding subunit ClpA
MSALPPRFIEDRALRDAARSVLDEDIARLRASLGEQGVASRVTSSISSTVTGRLKAGASDVLDSAKDTAADNRGVIAVLISAILLWLMRGPLLALVTEEDFAPADSADMDGADEAAQTPASLAEGD